jgi:hypothetical protein
MFSKQENATHRLQGLRLLRRGGACVFTEAELKMIDRDNTLRLMPTLRPV